jgi:hypothetical protein
LEEPFHAHKRHALRTTVTLPTKIRQ